VRRLKYRVMNDLIFLYLHFKLKRKRTNPMEYLDFELPIKELEDQLENVSDRSRI
jgi:hypothetical protein